MVEHREFFIYLCRLLHHKRRPLEPQKDALYSAILKRYGVDRTNTNCFGLTNPCRHASLINGDKFKLVGNSFHQWSQQYEAVFRALHYTITYKVIAEKVEQKKIKMRLKYVYCFW